MLLLSAGFLLVMHSTWHVNMLADLPVPLALPERLGSWEGSVLRFCQKPGCGASYRMVDLEDPEKCPDCGGELFSMSSAERALLPNDTEMIKAEYRNDQGLIAYVTTVISGYERASIHRPEVCLIGGGNLLLNSAYESVSLPGDERIKVKILTMQRGHGTRPWYYVYWFTGAGHKTPRHMTRYFWVAWDRIFKNRAYRWAYISISGGDYPKSDGCEYLLDIAGELDVWLSNNR